MLTTPISGQHALTRCVGEAEEAGESLVNRSHCRSIKPADDRPKVPERR